MGKDFRATMLERAIGRKLRDWRQESELSLTEAGRRVGFSGAKISMMENAVQASDPWDILALGFTYKRPAPERQELAKDAEWAERKRIFALVDKGVLFDAARDYMQLEFEATVLRTFKIDLLPGLFQIPGYIRAFAVGDDPIRGNVVAEQQIAMRAARQARLRAENPLRVEAVVCEAAIRQVVGGPQVMKAQLLNLMELAQLPNVITQIIPYSVVAYLAPGSPFDILSFPHEQHDDVVYLETVIKGEYVERPEDREPYTLRFAGLQKVALSPRESLELIAEVVSAL